MKIVKKILIHITWIIIFITFIQYNNMINDYIYVLNALRVPIELPIPHNIKSIFEKLLIYYHESKQYFPDDKNTIKVINFKMSLIFDFYKKYIDYILYPYINVIFRFYDLIFKYIGNYSILIERKINYDFISSIYIIYLLYIMVKYLYNKFIKNDVK